MQAIAALGLWTALFGAADSNFKVEVRDAKSERTQLEATASDIVVTAGCTTDPTGFDMKGKECSLSDCFIPSPGHGHLSQRTLERKFEIVKGPNAECNYTPRDFVSKYGAGSPLVEPKSFCVQVHASSRGGFLNIGDQGQVLCKFHINFDRELWP